MGRVPENKKVEMVLEAAQHDNMKGQVMSNGETVDLPYNLKLRAIATMKPEEFPTKKQIQDALPEHCFKYNNMLSLALVARDAVVIGSIFYVGWNFLPMESSPWFSLAWFAEKAAWHFYWFCQGTALVGWWVLAHECGHRGFSDNTYLCDAVGWVLHSFLLVPYFSWQYSHAVHHAKTNHLLDGESHVPPVNMGPYKKLFEVLGEDAFAIFELLLHWVFGWPFYLLINATGARRNVNGDRRKSTCDHFRPWSKLFPGHRGWDTRIFLSTFGVLLTLVGIYLAGTQWGHSKVCWFYFPSYLWANFWLVNYTWLQHTAPDLPHFGDEEWTWVRGALCTIDRPYGIFDWMHHHIGSTHVCHHLFSRMPCYHAVEATAALKAYLEPKGLYHYDPTNWVLASWRIARDCHYVESVNGIQHYKSLANAKKGSSKPKKAD
jgi:omega-6 fatty acid desaturase (delta-12 desaturase)